MKLSEAHQILKKSNDKELIGLANARIQMFRHTKARIKALMLESHMGRRVPSKKNIINHTSKNRRRSWAITRPRKIKRRNKTTDYTD
ncbi:MAG: hypothetical protein V1701_02640 [Planctomycetota bacterium]